MPITLKPLPFDTQAMEPFISAETLNVHYGKHHAGYVEKLNKLIRNTDYDKMTLEEIIVKSSYKIADETERSTFNCASQAWNHEFYWQCLSSQHEQSPSKSVLSTIKRNFGSASDFFEQFTEEAVSMFGSGWVWLVQNRDKSLEIFSGRNADSPLIYGMTPLLVCDVWEHAYYLDYRQDRKDYVEKFLASCELEDDRRTSFSKHN